MRLASLAVPVLVLVACGGGGTSSTLDATTGDGGGPDATELPPDAGHDAAVDAPVGTSPTRVTLDLRGTAYPALTRKLGMNENWDTVGGVDLNAIDAAAAGGAGIVAGLVEIDDGVADIAGTPNSVLFPSGLFVRDAGGVHGQVTANLQTLRDRVAAGAMMTMVQVAGTPCATTLTACLAGDDQTLFHVDPWATPTNSDGTGNWYPLPVEAQVAELGAALADLAVTAGADAHPTLWALWQEPDHTIDDRLTKVKSVRAYLALYKAFAAAVHAGDPDAMVVGPQQNQATGTNADHTIDGAGYAAFVTNDGRGVGEGAPVPLDVITIQNYLGTVSTAETIANTRVAYGDDRFNRAPVMFNEWDLDKNLSFMDAYDAPAGVTGVLDQLAVIADAPDVRAVLVTRNLYNPSSPTRTRTVLDHLGGMAALRRPVVVTGVASGDVRALASADGTGAAAIVWNRSDAAVALDVDLRGLAPGLVGRPLRVVVLSDAPTAVVVDRAVAAVDDVIEALTLPPHGVALVRVATPAPLVSGLRAARVARDVAWIDRLGAPSYAPPHGTGAFDIRTGQLVASVDGAGGVGAAGVVVRDVPAGYALAVTPASSGLPGGGGGATLAVVVDYLDGDDSLKTVVYQDPAYQGPMPAASLVPGARSTPVMVARPLLDGVTVTVPIAAAAPPGWGGRRRVLVSLVVAGLTAPATVVARLADAP